MAAAIGAVSRLPPEAQDEIARAMLALTHAIDSDEAPDEFEFDAELRESLAQAERGEFASDEDVRAMWAKYGL